MAQDKKEAVQQETVNASAAVPTAEKATPPVQASAEPATEPAKEAGGEPQVVVTVPEVPEKADEPKEEAAPLVEAGNITVNFKGADIKTVLAYISEVSNVDIVPAPDVKGVVDLKLTNKPWKVALDIILRNYGFAYEREGDIIRVVTVNQLKQEELTSQAFNLNYSKSKDVVESIKNIVSEKGKAAYDDRTNTIIVTDIPTNIYKISQIITRLDRQTKQVLIEARVIETVLDDSEKLGIDWNVKFSASGAKRPTTFPFDQVSVPAGLTHYFPQVQTNTDTTVADTGGGATGSSVVSAAVFPNTYGGSQAFPYATSTDFQYGTLDFSEFKAVLEMIKSRSNTDIVSNPRIATLDNKEAIINVGQTLNMPKYERNSSTGKMEITGYEPKILGVLLKVTPHINDNNEIVVDLQPEISDLLRYDTLDKSSGVVAPVFSNRFAKTQAMIKDGQTIFIGGLIKENDVDTKTKLPFIGDMLGDVPYLGLLFTKKSKTKQKTEMIFFVTVNLMADGKDIKGSPKADKALNPAYTITQEPDPGVKKKVKKRQ
jgi:type IV pilus assembly protein PilQ